MAVTSIHPGVVSFVAMIQSLFIVGRLKLGMIEQYNHTRDKYGLQRYLNIFINKRSSHLWHLILLSFYNNMNPHFVVGYD